MEVQPTKEKLLFFDEKRNQKIFKYYLSPKDVDGSSDYLLLDAPEGKSGDYSRVDTYILLQYLESKKINISSFLRSLLLMVLREASPSEVISTIEKESYTLLEKGSDIDKSVPLSLLHYIEKRNSNSDAYFTLLGTLFSEIGSKQMNRDAYSLITDFCEDNYSVYEERVMAEEKEKALSERNTTSFKSNTKIEEITSGISCVAKALGGVPEGGSVEIRIEELLSLGLFRFHSVVRSSDTTPLLREKDKRRSVSFDIKNSALSGRMVVTFNH